MAFYHFFTNFTYYFLNVMLIKNKKLLHKKQKKNKQNAMVGNLKQIS